MRTKLLLALPALLMLLHACDFGDAIGGGGGTGGQGLTGTIVDPQGVPVAGAKVRVFPEAAVPFAKGAAIGAARVDSTTTDINGHFRFTRLPDGVYNLTTFVVRHDTTLAAFVGGIDFDGTLDLGTDTLRIAGSLRITVRNAASIPLSGAVCAIPGSPWQAVSDSAGICIIAKAAPGEYSVTVSLEGDPKAKVDSINVVSGGMADAGVVLVEAEGESLVLPSSWQPTSLNGYVFYVPRDMRRSVLYGLDTWEESYSNGTVSFSIMGGMTGQVPWVDDTAAIGEWSLTIDSTTIRIIHAYSSSIRSQTVYMNVPSVGIFFGLCPDEVSCHDLIKMFRSLHVWTGDASLPFPPPLPPDLVSPPGNSISVPINVVLAWSATQGAEKYRVQVSASSDFSDAWYEDTVASPSTGVTGLTPNKDYYWRVEVLTGAWPGVYSATGKFTTGEGPSSWTPRVSGTSASFRGLVWTGSQLVAVGDSGIVTSTDGVAWTQRSNVPARTVIWTGTQLVAAGNSGRILTSSDGMAWTTRTACTGGNYNGLTWTGSRLVVVGQGGSICTSLNGINWASAATGVSRNLTSVAWSGSRLVAFGNYSLRLTSLDGIEWSEQSSSLSDDFSWYVGAVGNLLMATGSGGTLLVSPDGLSWYSRKQSTPPALYGVGVRSGGFIAVGESGTVLLSPDGVLWQRQYSGTFSHLLAVVQAGDRLVAVGSGGTILTSP